MKLLVAIHDVTPALWPECRQLWHHCAARGVAPAWLATRATYRAVARHGLRISEDASRVYLHDRAMTLPSPAVRWSARSGVRASLSAAVAGWRWRLQRRAPLVRLALHPADLRQVATSRSLVGALDRWTESRPVWRYAQL